MRRRLLPAAVTAASLVALATGAAVSAPTDQVAGSAQARRGQVPGLPPLPASCRVPKGLLVAGSRAVGRPARGRLVNGVPFPEESDYAFTWDFPQGVSPSPQWRRWGTQKLVLTVSCVLAAYGARHPELARIGVADLSLPRGGPFGRRYGGLGHASHQNGLDVDVLYPRTDLCECPPDEPADVDAARAQELVDAFVRAGARYVFVSPVLHRRGRLRGPRRVVVPWPHHDDHLHVRITP
jgi:murein endopeptidase